MTVMLRAEVSLILNRFDGGFRQVYMRRLSPAAKDSWLRLPYDGLRVGESVHEAAMRIGLEQAGVVVPEVALRPFTVIHEFSRMGLVNDQDMRFYFIAKDWAGKPNTDGNQAEWMGTYRPPGKLDDVDAFVLKQLDVTSLPISSVVSLPRL